MQEPKSKNITWVEGSISRDDREKKNQHKGAVIWLTGLSGSGKTTVAIEVERRLYAMDVSTYRLDGDNIRYGLNKDLGFSEEDRNENIRRIGEVAKLMCDSGLIVLTSFISPYRSDRDCVRNLMNRPTDFIEVFVNCPIEESEKRDPKGLYKKAREGQIKNFTGIDAPYEAPENPEIEIHTAVQSVEESAESIICFLKENGYLS